MAGRRLLDLVSLLKASRGVAQKHVALRKWQLDILSKTSTLAGALKSQTDRVTLTVRAASALSNRFNENRSTFSTKIPDSEPNNSIRPVSNRSSVGEAVHDTLRAKEGVDQDHFYVKSDKNSTKEPLPQDSLRINQEQAQGAPLPDGTILPASSELGQPTTNTDTVSAVPQTESAKDPLTSKNNGNSVFEPTANSTNSIPMPETRSTPPSANQARKLQRQAEDPIPSTAAEPPAATPTGAEEVELGVDQEMDVYYNPSTTTKPVFSALPRLKVPKITETTQEGDLHVPTEQINQDVYYSSRQKHLEDSIPQKQAIPEQGEPSDEMYSELFHSPKVAKMLSGKGVSYKGSLQPHGQTVRPELSQKYKDPKQCDSEVRSTRITPQDNAENVELNRHDIENPVYHKAVDSVPRDTGISAAISESENEMTLAQESLEQSSMPTANNEVSPDDVRQRATDLAKDAEVSFHVHS